MTRSTEAINIRPQKFHSNALWPLLSLLLLVGDLMVVREPSLDRPSATIRSVALKQEKEGRKGSAVLKGSAWQQ